jgi:hypothetical protein
MHAYKFILVHVTAEYGEVELWLPAFITHCRLVRPFELNTPVLGHFQAFKLLKKGMFLLTFPCCN